MKESLRNKEEKEEENVSGRKEGKKERRKRRGEGVKGSRPRHKHGGECLGGVLCASLSHATINDPTASCRGCGGDRLQTIQY